MVFKLISIYNIFLFKTNSILLYLNNAFTSKTSFLFLFYKKNELIWQEGLLIDFLQKKSFDVWTKKFLIYSSYLFNERLVFDKIVKFFINLVILPFQKIFIFELTSVANFFFINIITFFFIFFIIILFFLFFQFF